MKQGSHSKNVERRKTPMLERGTISIPGIPEFRHDFKFRTSSSVQDELLDNINLLEKHKILRVWGSQGSRDATALSSPSLLRADQHQNIRT